MNDVKLEKLNVRYDEPSAFSDKWLDGAVGEAVERIDRLLLRFGDCFPSASTVNGVYQPVEKVDWTEGFWTGELWMAYELTKEERYRHAAERFLPAFRQRLEQRIKTNTHDLGFLYSLSCVAAWKLTGNREARETALMAAELLYGRYHEKAGIVQAWGDLNDPEKQGRMIIDCNLNLPLLFWAAKEEGRKDYYQAAVKHLQNAMKYLVRQDGSTFHTYFMDVHTGLPLRGTTHQGYSDESCWSRGQAWAIYGFALNYRSWNCLDLIELSKKTANYYLNRLPKDYIPYWDLIFKPEDNQVRDSSSASIAACGLLELLRELPLMHEERKRYEHGVCHMMMNLRDHYLTGNEDGILMHGVYNYGRNMGIDEQNLWGDYFYIEALRRLKRVWNPYW